MQLSFSRLHHPLQDLDKGGESFHNKNKRAPKQLRDGAKKKKAYGMVACHLTRIRLEMVTPKYKEKDLLEVKTET